MIACELFCGEGYLHEIPKEGVSKVLITSRNSLAVGASHKPYLQIEWLDNFLNGLNDLLFHDLSQFP